MKLITSLTLFCLACLGLSQVTTTASFANPLPIGRIVASGNAFAVKSETKTQDVYFNGTAVSGDALNWGTPDELMTRLSNDGINLWRPHHFDTVSLSRVIALADAGYKRGMYFCFDLVGDRWMNRKNEVYEGTLRGELSAELDRLKPLLNHPGLAYVAIVNEGATGLKGKYNNDWAKLARLVDETYAWFKSELAKRGYMGLVADLADSNIDARFAPIVAKQDMLVTHGYGTHNDSQKWKDEVWAKTSVHLGSMLNHIINLARKVESAVVGDAVMVPSPKPAIIQEFACMPFNPSRGFNELMWRTELFRRGISVCSYAYATNQSQLRGTHTEVHDFALITDPPRYYASIAGALLYKYGKGAQTDWFYGPNQIPAVSSYDYRYATDKVKVFTNKDRGSIFAIASPKKRYVVILDQMRVRGTQFSTGSDGWIITTARGGKVFGDWAQDPIDVGFPVSGAYQNGATLRKSGNLIWPLGSGVIEVNLK